jgi:hypothetical protein
MTFENKNMQCSSCRFWWPTGEATGNEPICEHSILDQCRRYAPPAQVTDLPDHGRHLSILGDHQARRLARRPPAYSAMTTVPARTN